ncbi:MAG: CHAT domain-containing protein [Bacteroidia bacterium]
MKKNLFTLLCLFFVGNSFSQIDFKGALNKAKDDAIQKAKETGNNKMDESRKEFDESNFNYAISFSDNAGLFETKEKSDRLKNSVIGGYEAVTNKNNTDLTIEEAKKFNNSGEVFFAGNKYHSAEFAFKQALFIYEKNSAQKTAEYALVESNLALLYQTTGRYVKAEKYSELALALRKELDQKSAAYAASENNKAVLLKDEGKYNESEELINKAVEDNATSLGKNSVPYAIALNNKAMLLQLLGRNTDAEQLMNQVLSITKEKLKESSSNYIRLTINLALLYQDMGKFSEAETIYLNAIKLKEKKLGKSHPDYAYLKRGLASLYLQMGKTAEVESLLKEALDIYKRKFGDNHPATVATMVDLGNFYRINNRLPEAEALLTDAVKKRGDLLGMTHPDYIKSLEDLAIVQWQSNKIKDAAANYTKVMDATMTYIDTYFAPMSESEKAKFWDKISPRLQRFNSFVADESSSDPELTGQMFNYQLKTKALLLNATNKVKNAILTSDNENLKNLYTQWLDQKELLARLYTLSKEELADEKVNLDSLEQETNKLEKQLSAQSNAFKQGYSGASVVFTDLAKKLNEDECIVDIIEFKKFNGSFTNDVYYATLILTKNSTQPVLLINKNGVELESNAIKYYRGNIKDIKPDNDSYSKYWADIDKAITGKKTVYVSLDGVYNQISLNTLKDATGKYLIDSKNLILVTNSKDVLELKNNPQKNGFAKTATLVGFPNYGGEDVIPSLPGTKLEVENINPILKSNGYQTYLFEGDDASETNVKLAKTSILHIATHGFFLANTDAVEDEKVLGIETSKAKNNPLHRSGLLLANCEKVFDGTSDLSNKDNGILTAYETMNMSLDNTQLVVLSACETGLGDIKAGEGVYGLQRAFQVAGAKAIIMSLWQVSDDATMELMTNFYKNFMMSGNKQEAFIKAEKQIKLKYKDPFYWGAFVLIGN